MLANILMWGSVAIVAILPILLVYPFVLKFFTKGVTVGSVKG